MYPDSRQPMAARPSTTERRRQGRKKARKAIRGLAMALRVTAKWYTVLPYGRQEYDCMEGRAPLERQHTRHCTSSRGEESEGEQSLEYTGSLAPPHTQEVASAGPIWPLLLVQCLVCCLSNGALP